MLWIPGICTTKSCVSFISLFPYVKTKDKPFFLPRLMNRNMKWFTHSMHVYKVFYNFLYWTSKLSHKKGQKTDPSCFMNRSNLSSDARILVERFKIIHIQNLPLQKTSLVPLLTPPRNTCKKNAVVTREEDTKIGSQSSKSTRQSVTL